MLMLSSWLYIDDMMIEIRCKENDDYDYEDDDDD
jgi:hypothetical protein